MEPKISCHYTKEEEKGISDDSGYNDNIGYKTFAYSTKKQGEMQTKCQNTFCIMEKFYEDMTFMAIYDGHGQYGQLASDLANNAVKKYLLDNKEQLYRMDTEEEVEMFFKEMCSTVQDIYNADSTYYQLSGTCAIMVLIKEDMIYTGNLGDSRAVIGSCSKDETVAIDVSNDHKPTEDNEKVRILSAGGKIERIMTVDREVGPYRVWEAGEYIPGISVSRSFGDLIARKIGVSAEPEVIAKEIDYDDKFIIIASGGVWDVISSTESVEFLFGLPAKDKEVASERIATECKKRWDLLDEMEKKQVQVIMNNTWLEHELENNIARDDITVVIHYLFDFE